MPSALKQYLDGLANGPLLDPVVPVKHISLYAEEGREVAKELLTKRRKEIAAACAKTKPLVVRRRKKHKT